MSQLEIRFFGECQFIDDGQRIPGLQTKRMRSLLGYLVLHAGQQISATHLAFLFWPDSSEKQARTNLRRAFYNLRQAFPQSDEFLERGDHTVRWRGDGAFSLDVAEFETSIGQARTLLQQTGHDAAIRQHLEAAIARYRGDLLPDCYDDWIAPLRERLRQDYLYAIEQLMEICEAEGDYAAAIRHGEVLLREDPLRERSYHRLMQLYMLNGDRPAALGVYHTCASQLERELGVEPQASLTALYNLLLEQDDPADAAPPRSPHQSAAGRLVGRKRERKQLFAAWRKAARGQARVALIQGEAGIGKTRLAEELFHWANQLGITAVRTRVYAASSNLAYAPIVEWLRSEPLAPRLREVDHARLAELARLAPEILTFHGDLPSAEPLAEDWQRTRLFEALAHTVCGDRQPLLLWIDDLQWCDSESLAWFQYLMRFDPGAPLLILGTARDEELAPDHPLTLLEHQLRRDDQLTAINLKRLSDDEMVELGRLVARDHLDEQELKLQSGRAGGNPLFMVEMTRASLDAMPTGSTSSPGAGDERPAHDAPNERVDAFDLPPKVYSIIQARLAQLSPPARELLGLAAAIGRAFTFDLLTHASEMSESLLVQSLDELWRRRIVNESKTGPSDYAYDFSHDRIRDVAYAEISSIRRRFHHRAVAKALVSVYADRIDEWSADVAYHCEQSGNAPLAVQYYRRAGQRAAGQFVHQDAIRYMTRALALAEASDLATRYDLHALRAHVHFVRADRAAQVQDLDAMMALAKAMDEAPKYADVWLQRAALAEAQGAYAEAIGFVEQATRVVQDDETAHRDVAAAIQLGSIYWNQGDYLKADANYQRGLALARAAGDRNTEATILLHLGALNAYYGPYDTTKAIVHQALDAARSLGNEEGQVWASNQLGFLIVEQGDDDYEEAEHALINGLLLARKIGHCAYIAKLSNNLALLHDRCGRRGQGLACLNESLAIATETGSARHEAFAQNYRGGILLNEMKLDAAHTAYAQALSRFRAIGYRQGEGKTLSEMALLALMMGDHEQGHRYAADALEIAKQIGIQRDQAYALTRLGYASEGMANLTAAAEVYEQAIAIYRMMNQRSRGLEPAAGLARIAYAQGDHTRALAGVESIIAAVQQRALVATIEAEWVYLSCLQISHATDDSTHVAVLTQANQLYDERCAMLSENGDLISLKTQLHTFCNAFETPLALE